MTQWSVSSSCPPGPGRSPPTTRTRPSRSRSRSRSRIGTAAEGLQADASADVHVERRVDPSRRRQAWAASTKSARATVPQLVCSGCWYSVVAKTIRRPKASPVMMPSRAERVRAQHGAATLRRNWPPATPPAATCRDTSAMPDQRGDDRLRPVSPSIEQWRRAPACRTDVPGRPPASSRRVAMSASRSSSARALRRPSTAARETEAIRSKAAPASQRSQLVTQSESPPPTRWRVWRKSPPSTGRRTV